MTHLTVKITNVNLARHRDWGQNVLNISWFRSMHACSAKKFKYNTTLAKWTVDRFSFTLSLKGATPLYCAAKSLTVFPRTALTSCLCFSTSLCSGVNGKKMALFEMIGCHFSAQTSLFLPYSSHNSSQHP